MLELSHVHGTVRGVPADREAVGDDDEGQPRDVICIEVGCRGICSNSAVGGQVAEAEVSEQ